MNNEHVLYMIKINEPQLPWLQTAIIYHTGLDEKKWKSPNAQDMYIYSQCSKGHLIWL